MSTIVLDPSSTALLRSCTEPTVLRDAEGNVVGYFEPPARLYEEGEIPEFDEAELDRREQRWQGIPSAEVRRMLENLRCIIGSPGIQTHFVASDVLGSLPASLNPASEHLMRSKQSCKQTQNKKANPV
jgi:hypothetical protein